jgi:ribosome-interacting GTPase 1
MLFRLVANYQRSILHEYRLHNCELLIREDVTTDDVIDVIEGNRKYVKCLYAYNKVRMRSCPDMPEGITQQTYTLVSPHPRSTR